MQGLPEEDEEGDLNFGVIPEDIPASTKPIEGNILKYVAGYVVKKIGKLPCNCKESFLARREKEDFDEDIFLNFKEYVKTRSSHRSLRYVNGSFLEKMKKALGIIKYIFNRFLYKPRLIDFTTKILCERINFTQCFHENKIKKTIFKYFIKVNLFNYCKQINMILKGLDLRSVPQSAPKIFINARNMQLNNLKRKKVQNKNRFVT